MCSYCTKDIQTGEEAHVRSGARAGNFTVAPGSPVEQPLLLSGMWDREQEEGCVMGGITAYPAPDRPPAAGFLLLSCTLYAPVQSTLQLSC